MAIAEVLDYIVRIVTNCDRIQIHMTMLSLMSQSSSKAFAGGLPCVSVNAPGKRNVNGPLLSGGGVTSYPKGRSQREQWKWYCFSSVPSGLRDGATWEESCESAACLSSGLNAPDGYSPPQHDALALLCRNFVNGPLLVRTVSVNVSEDMRAIQGSLRKRSQWTVAYQGKISTEAVQDLEG